jgi:hypothetical protein
MRPDNAAAHLAVAQSGRKEAAEKSIRGNPLLHPPDARAPHPGKGLRPSALLIEGEKE